MQGWDEVSIWTIEQFGLPGQEYVTDMTADYMTWSFKDPYNAVLFRLKYGEFITRG